MAAQKVQYKGIDFPCGYNSVKSLQFAENEFQVQDGDIFNITYPKSGTVWMIEILSLILNEGNPALNQSVLNSLRAPWFTTQLGLETAHNLPSPRLLTCHLPIQIFPKTFFNSNAKVVYTVRDPRDVLVSYYHFSKMCPPFGDPKSFNHFFENFLNGDVLFGSWFDHFRGWMKLKGKSNFFVISYEQLHQVITEESTTFYLSWRHIVVKGFESVMVNLGTPGVLGLQMPEAQVSTPADYGFCELKIQNIWSDKDLRGSVERLCHFLGKELDEAAITSVVQNASFEAMQNNRMCNSTMLPKELMNQKKGNFLRKGICGDWKTHFTVAQSEYFERVYQEKMQGLKGIFPWQQSRLESNIARYFHC